MWNPFRKGKKIRVYHWLTFESSDYSRSKKSKNGTDLIGTILMEYKELVPEEHFSKAAFMYLNGDVGRPIDLVTNKYQVLQSQACVFVYNRFANEIYCIQESTLGSVEDMLEREKKLESVGFKRVWTNPSEDLVDKKTTRVGFVRHDEGTKGIDGES